MLFPALGRTGRRVADTFRRRPIALRLWCWVAAALATLPYIWLRGIADDAGMPREQVTLGLERLIGFGKPLSERLQDWLYTGSVQPLDWVMCAVHLSWFLAPEIITVYVVVLRWDLFPQLAAVRLGVLYMGLIGFFLLPTEPPWMAVDVVRILEVANGEPLQVDNNALAALPSLHVALPAALMMWLWTVRLPKLALLLTLLTAMMILAVVYLGEHYLVDALAGLALAYIAVQLVVRFLPSGARPTSAAATRTVSGAARSRSRPPAPAPPSRPSAPRRASSAAGRGGGA